MSRFTSPIARGKDSFRGEGNFFGIATLGSTIFVTSNGDDTKGWINKAELAPEDQNPIPLHPFIASKIHTSKDAPTGATISPDGKLVVSQMGNINAKADSVVGFYDPKTGKLEKLLETGLRDLVAIAYSPTTGVLYGLDFAWAKPDEGGMFRLEPVGKKLKAIKVAALVKPTALAFGPDGKLYVTIIGSSPSEENTAGRLLLFSKDQFK